MLFTFLNCVCKPAIRPHIPTPRSALGVSVALNTVLSLIHPSSLTNITHITLVKHLLWSPSEWVDIFALGSPCGWCCPPCDHSVMLLHGARDSSWGCFLLCRCWWPLRRIALASTFSSGLWACLVAPFSFKLSSSSNLKIFSFWKPEITENYNKNPWRSFPGISQNLKNPTKQTNNRTNKNPKLPTKSYFSEQTLPHLVLWVTSHMGPLRLSFSTQSLA